MKAPQVPEISASDLRRALEEGRALRVLDVRPRSERADWWVPGSDHVDAYRALWAGDGSVLRRHVDDWPREIPVVAVCAEGNTSRLAADALREMGFDAYSLAGGMRAWSAAWNVAGVHLPDADSPTVLQVRRTGKGCLSYLVGSGDAAAVIDASVDPEVYLSLARANGWEIDAVIETHVHADHVSRAHALARAAQATVYMPAQERVQLPFEPLSDGAEVPVGSAAIRALHTPGHTPESISLLIDGLALATGDTLFLESVGRPDLGAGGEDAVERAHSLYRSLAGRLLDLPDELVLLPGHSPAPLAFEGIAHVAPLAEVRQRIPLLKMGEVEFVEALLDRTPSEAPENHLAIIRINEGRDRRPSDLTPLEVGSNRCAVSV